MNAPTYHYQNFKCYVISGIFYVHYPEEALNLMGETLQISSFEQNLSSIIEPNLNCILLILFIQ